MSNAYIFYDKLVRSCDELNYASTVLFLTLTTTKRFKKKLC